MSYTLTLAANVAKTPQALDELFIAVGSTSLAHLEWITKLAEAHGGTYSFTVDPEPTYVHLNEQIVFPDRESLDGFYQAMNSKDPAVNLEIPYDLDEYYAHLKAYAFTADATVTNPDGSTEVLFDLFA